MAVGANKAGTVPAAVAFLVGTALKEMTIMKLSMIATGLVAATLLGTVGVGVFAARPQNGEKAVAPNPNAPAAIADSENSKPTGISPDRDWRSPPWLNVHPGANSPRVIWAKLKSAAENFQTLRALHQAAQIEFGRVTAARGEIETLAAELNACADDLNDEVDLLKAQLKIREADVKATEGHLAIARLELQFKQKLLNDKVISTNTTNLSKQEVNIRSAELAKKQAELNEVVLRIKQATRRRDEAISLAERAKGLVPAPELPATTEPPAPAPEK
jgi:hypothetical protein